MPKKCPQCRLISDDTALRCDCGYDFATAQVHGVPAPPARTARQDLLTGLVLFLVAYAVQLLAIPVHLLFLNILSLGLYGVSFFYLIRGLIIWVRRKR